MEIVDLEIIEKTAQLARLAVSEEEKLSLKKDLNEIFELFESINKEEIKALKPLSNPLEMSQRMREDVAVSKNMHPAIKQNAPLEEDDFITVPKVL